MINFSAGLTVVTMSAEVEAVTDTDTDTHAAGKPTPEELGIDVDRVAWERSGDGDGSVEIAFPLSAAWSRGDWVLMRVAEDPAGRVLVFDRNEWVCFLDGVRNGEFDDATDQGGSDS